MGAPRSRQLVEGFERLGPDGLRDGKDVVGDVLGRGAERPFGRGKCGGDTRRSGPAGSDELVVEPTIPIEAAPDLGNRYSRVIRNQREHALREQISLASRIHHHHTDLDSAAGNHAQRVGIDGDPGGFLDLYDEDVTYFDPVTPARLDGRSAMAKHYAPWTGKISVARYELLNPQVVVDANIALLTYNLVNYVRDADGKESLLNQWNSTVVFRRGAGGWKSIHSHWSFTRHPALTNLGPEANA